MNGVTLRQLAYFVAAADCGTVSEAAGQCHASQAAVSTGLTELEKALGQRLLLRLPSKGVVVTAGGQRLLPIARRLLDGAAELAASARAEKAQVAGPLRIACTHALSPRLLPALVEQMEANHPLVALTLTDGMAAEVEDMVASGRADAGFLYGQQVGLDLDTRLIHEVVPHVVLPADHPLAGQETVSLHSLAGERLILVDRFGSRGFMEWVVRQAGVVPRSGWALSNPEAVRSMVGRGLGYSVFSGRPAGTESFDGHRVVYVPVSDAVPKIKVVMVTLPGVAWPARLQALADLLDCPDIQQALG